MDEYYFSADTELGVGALAKSGAQLQELVKAMTAQEGVTDYVTLQNGGALMPQSLEMTYASLSYGMEQFKFQKDIGITKAYSTVEEYSLLDGWGSEGTSVDQMENPEEDDPELFKDWSKIKFFRSMWRVGDVLGEVKTITDPYALNIQAAIYRLMRGLERQLFFGDEGIISQEIMGIEASIVKNATADHIIDMRGNPLSQEVMRQAAELISDNFGTPSKMYVSNSTLSSLGDIMGNKDFQRIIQNQGSTGISLGNPIEGFKSNFGNFPFIADVFLNWETMTVPKIKNPANPRQLIEGATSAKAPAMPSLALAAVADADTLHGALTVGVRFRVAAVNRFGKSVACAASAQIALTAGQSYELTITDGAGSNATAAYEIYRETGENTQVYRLIKRVKTAGATTVYLDANDDLPGTAKSFLMDLTSVGEMRSIAISQLSPIHKLEYARNSPARWGTCNWYLGTKVYGPGKMVMFKNIGVGKAQSSPLLDV